MRWFGRTGTKCTTCTKMNFMERYARQLMLPEFGIEAQEKLRRSHVLLIGAGGLGSTIAPLLCAAGLGKLTLIDADKVSESNLQRQILYRTSQIGQPKAECARKSLQNLNPDCEVMAINAFLNQENALEISHDCQIIVDGSDNAQARYLMNDLAVGLGIPYVYGSIEAFHGQVSVFNLNPRSATYRCLFPEPKTLPEPQILGVIGTLPSFIASIQANECIKALTGCGPCLDNRLFTCDLLSMQTHCFDLQPTDSGRDISLQNFQKLIASSTR